MFADGSIIVKGNSRCCFDIIKHWLLSHALSAESIMVLVIISRDIIYVLTADGLSYNKLMIPMEFIIDGIII